MYIDNVPLVDFSLVQTLSRLIISCCFFFLLLLKGRECFISRIMYNLESVIRKIKKRKREWKDRRFFIVSRFSVLCYIYIIYTVYTRYIYPIFLYFLVLSHFANPDMLVSNKSYCSEEWISMCVCECLSDIVVLLVMFAQFESDCETQRTVDLSWIAWD